MAIYSVEKLMDETRRLAVEFRKTTGQALAVTGELANYDAHRLLNLTLPVEAEATVDAIGPELWSFEKIQIKGRVLFDKQKTKQRIGQLNLEGAWQRVLLVLYNESYLPEGIYCLSKQQILADLSSAKANKRGAMTVAKFKAMGEQVWPLVDNASDEPAQHTG